MDTPAPVRRRAILLITSLSNFLTPFMGSAVNVALPAIGRDFGLSAVALTWVMMAYLLGTAALLVPFGRLSDLHGRARIFRLGLLVYTTVSVLLALAPSGNLLVAFRAAQGMGSAMIFCTAMPLLIAAYPPSERGRALGFNIAAVYLGLSLGPVLGGLITQHLGWQMLFWLTAGLGGVTLALAVRTPMPEPARHPGGRYDAAGAVLYTAAVIALGVSFPLLQDLFAFGIGLLAAGVLGLAAFVVRGIRVAQPVLDLRLFRANPLFLFSNLAALILYAASSSVGVLLSLYLQHIRGLPADQAGLALLTQPVLMTLFSPLAGRLSDRFQPRLVATIGMAVTTAGTGLLILLTTETPLAAVLGALGLLGLGFAFFSSPNTNAVLGAVPPASTGVATAVLSTMRVTGFVVSMGLVMLVLAVHVGREPLAPPIYPQFMASLQTAFPVMTGLGVLGIFASLARGNVERTAKK
jgi:EmrB/QacA subfamily drug resistance transporter